MAFGLAGAAVGSAQGSAVLYDPNAFTVAGRTRLGGVVVVWVPALLGAAQPTPRTPVLGSARPAASLSGLGSKLIH